MDALNRAIHTAGGVGALAKAINVGQTVVSNWRTRGSVPPEHCAAIDQATGVRRWDLRPDDWHRIWPELIGAEGAPKVEGAAPAPAPAPTGQKDRDSAEAEPATPAPAPFAPGTFPADFRTHAAGRQSEEHEGGQVVLVGKGA
jgi:DNA-binding transcriptional regulator YdaS (Cro superfamily)